MEKGRHKHRGAGPVRVQQWW